MNKFGNYAKPLSIILTLVIAAIAGYYLATSEFSIGDSSASSKAEITVSGNRILRNGEQFTPKGVIITGLLAHRQVRGDGNHLDRLYAARDHFHPKLFTVAKEQWRSNTVRLNINQGGLDPRSRTYDSSYLKRIRAAVEAAQKEDLVVILAMFNGIGEDRSVYYPLPTNRTRRAWDQLVPAFKNDQDVVFELFNEPASLRRKPTGSTGSTGAGFQSARIRLCSRAIQSSM